MPIIGDQLFIYSPTPGQSVVKIFISKLDENRVNFFGTLIGIFEIGIDDKKLFDILDDVAQELERTYYDFSQINRNGINIEEHFEKSIKLFNAKFERILTENKLDSKLSRINIAIGVLKNNQVFFTYINDIYAFLIYKTQNASYRIADIIGNYKGMATSDKINKYNIFSFTLNGKFKINDYLFLCNRNFLDHLPLDDIKYIITHNSPTNAIETLRTSLWKESLHTTFAGIVLHNKPGVGTKQEHDGVGMSQKSLNKLLRTEDNTEKLLSMSLSPNIQKTKKDFLMLIQKAICGAKNLQSRINTEKIKKYALNVKNNTISIFNIIQKILLSIIQIIKKQATSTYHKWSNKKSIHKHSSKNFESVSRKQVKQPHVIIKKDEIFVILHGGISTFSQKILSFVNVFKNLFSHIIQHAQVISLWKKINFSRLKDKRFLLKWLIIFCGILLLVIFIVNIFSQKDEKNFDIAEKDFQMSISNVQEKLNEAQAALIYDDRPQAKQILNDVEKMIAALILDTDNKKNTAEALKKQFQEYINTINNIITIDATKTAFNLSSLNESESVFLLGIIPNGSDLYLYSNNNYLYKIIPSNGSIKKLSAKPSTNAKIKTAHSEIDKHVAIILHEDNVITTLDMSNDTISNGSILLNNEEKKLPDFSIYNNKFYSLSPKGNQIYRHSSTLNGYGLGNAWIKSNNININNATSICIDGVIYVLENNGTVRQFYSGQEKEYHITNPNPPFNTANKIFTTAESKYLYILESQQKRVVVLNKETGEPLTQYISTRPGDLRDFSVNEQGKKIYFLQGNILYLVDAKHIK